METGNEIAHKNIRPGKESEDLKTEENGLIFGTHSKSP
jgi:hypothetical protein